MDKRKSDPAEVGSKRLKVRHENPLAIIFPRLVCLVPHHYLWISIVYIMSIVYNHQPTEVFDSPDSPPGEQCRPSLQPGRPAITGASPSPAHRHSRIRWAPNGHVFSVQVVIVQVITLKLRRFGPFWTVSDHFGLKDAERC